MTFDISTSPRRPRSTPSSPEACCGKPSRECSRAAARLHSREGLWRVLEGRGIGTALEGRTSLPYRELGALIGAGTEAQVANLLTTAKRMFVRTFKSVVRDYEADDAALETELQALRHILSNT